MFLNIVIIIKTKVLFLQELMALAGFWLMCLRPFDFARI